MLLVPLLALLVAPRAAQDGPDPVAALETALAEAGIRLDLEAGACSVPARVLVTNELLEYLLVGPRGAAHESLFVTEAVPSLLNTAFLALGLEPGENADWRRVGAEGEEPRVEITPPRGDSLFLYALWREGDEVYFHRVEDLLRNLSTGRAMQRHGWVYLGSRFATYVEDEPPVFAADREENLVNIAFFREGNTLLTAALEDCLDQTIWVANGWLLPERGWPVQVVFSKQRLTAPPADWVRALPVEPAEADARGGGE